MPDLMMEITPPRSDTRLGNISPGSYLTNIAILSPVRKKSSLPNFQERDLRKLRLDPSPTNDDRTILEYHSRVMSLAPVDRTKINVRMPFTTTLEKMVSTMKVRFTLVQS
jgi:hypothetical protein